MANDQFSIPGAGQSREAYRIADSLQSAEREPSVYGRIKAIEDRVHGYRRTALEIEAKRPEPVFFKTLLLGRQKRMTLEGFIETETYIGGEAFSKTSNDPRVARVVNRFWLSHKGSSVLANGNDLGDWYHVREMYDTYGRKIEEVTIHLETHPTHIVKIVSGKPVQLSIAELEIFVRAVELYEKNVRERLYPFDQEIFDLFEEIDQENIQAPLALEDRFDKEIIERVTAAYNDYKRMKSQQMPNTVDSLLGREYARQPRNDPRTKL